MSFLPNLITGSRLIMGVVSVVLACQGRMVPAAWLIVVASVLDSLDGRIARWLHSETEFGAYFDSVADFVVFAVAPAWLFYEFNRPLFADLAWGAAFFSVLPSLFRLIRFHRIQAGRHAYFLGLPMPAGAGLFASFILIYGGEGLTSIGVCLSLSVLMASRLRFMNFESSFAFMRQRRRYVPFLAVVFVFGVINLSFVPFIAYALYTLICLARIVRARVLKRDDIEHTVSH
jgi:CDP-diacylglycerol---serine O-phosphatidyltransferase